MLRCLHGQKAVEWAPLAQAAICCTGSPTYAAPVPERPSCSSRNAQSAQPAAHTRDFAPQAWGVGSKLGRSPCQGGTLVVPRCSRIRPRPRWPHARQLGGAPRAAAACAGASSVSRPGGKRASRCGRRARRHKWRARTSSVPTWLGLGLELAQDPACPEEAQEPSWGTANAAAQEPYPYP